LKEYIKVPGSLSLAVAVQVTNVPTGWGEESEGASWTVGVAPLVGGTNNATANATMDIMQFRRLTEYVMNPPGAGLAVECDFYFRRGSSRRNQFRENSVIECFYDPAFEPVTLLEQKCGPGNFPG